MAISPAGSAKAVPPTRSANSADAALSMILSQIGAIPDREVGPIVTRSPTTDIDGLAASVASGDRKALARGITLVESTRIADREAAEKLLTDLLPQTGSAIRIGISGAPGA